MSTSNKASTPPNSPAYDDVIKLTRKYFGSDGPKHVTRFLRTHLEKTPDQITGEDIVSLIYWLRILVTFLEDDEQVIERYIADLYKRIAPEVFGESTDE